MAHRHSVPRHKRLSRQARLQAAPYWMAKYSGSNLLRGYRKHFGVDFECALKELTVLGITFDPQYISQCRQSLQGQHLHRRSRREAYLKNQEMTPNDDWFGVFEAMGMDFLAADDPFFQSQNGLGPYGDKHPDRAAERPPDLEWRCRVTPSPIAPAISLDGWVDTDELPF